VRPLLPLILSSLLAALAAFGSGNETAQACFPLAAVGAAVISLMAFFSAQIQDSALGGGLATRLKAGGRRWTLPVAWSTLLVTLSYLAVGGEVRVLTDESTLLSTALHIYLTGKAQLINIGLYFNDQFLPVGLQTPLRPVLYPLLVALVHMVTGYRLANGFVISFLGMVVGLTAVIGLTRTLGRSIVGYLAAALIATFPLVALATTSCGLESLNLGLVLLTLYFLLHFVLTPSWQRFEAALYASILAAQCRYETALLVPVVVSAAVMYRGTLRYVRPSYRLLVAPWLLVPSVWQRLISSSINGGDKVDAPFGLQYLWPNLRHAVEFFTPSWPSLYPISSTVVVSGLVGIGLAIARIEAGEHAVRCKYRRYFTLTGAYICATLVIHCLYYVGDLREPQLMRIGVIYAAMFALFAAYLLVMIARRPVQQLLMVVLTTVICSRGLAIAAVNAHGKTHAGYLEYKRNLALIESYPRDGTLVIDHHPVMYVPSRYGTVNFEYANSATAQILSQLNAKILQHVLVIQRINNQEPSAVTRLTDAFQLTPLVEYRTTADYTVRISRAEPRH